MSHSLALIYHQDPGHGWVEIDRATARRVLGVSYRRISPYSYRRGEQLFLEEDRDAGLLQQACRQAGITLQLIERHTNSDSPIRSFRSFYP